MQHARKQDYNEINEILFERTTVSSRKYVLIGMKWVKRSNMELKNERGNGRNALPLRTPKLVK